MFSSHYDMLFSSCIPRPAAGDHRWKPAVELAPNCPRCDSSNTKFCYYNNYSLSQPRYFCKACRRYWTKGGSLRNVPVGGGCRKNRRGKAVRLSSVAAAGRDVINPRPRCLPPGPVFRRPDLMLNNDMVRSRCMADSDGSAIDLEVLYAKYTNQCPPVDSGVVVPSLPMAEGDLEPVGSSAGTSRESTSCNNQLVPVQLPHPQQVLLECQSITQPVGEDLLHRVYKSYSNTEDYNYLSMDLSNSLTLPMELVDNYTTSLDFPSVSNFLYQQFESAPGSSMHHQQSLGIINDDWSTLDYSTLEAFYRC